MASWEVQEVFSIRKLRAWGFPNNKMSSSGARLNRSFFRCVRTAAVLAILSNLNIRRYNALPLSPKQERKFFENFSFRYLRFELKMFVVKWKEKIFWPYSTNGKKVSVVKWKEFFDMPDRTRSIRKEICLNEQELNLIQQKCASWGHTTSALTPARCWSTGISSRSITPSRKS